MDFSKLQQEIVSLQKKVSDEMGKIKEMAAREPQLPKPSASFTTAQALVADNNYEVVVCGEVKKGKSSFINALLGQRLLPVNSDVATAQVFRISDAPEESFRLVFTDGTDKKISKEELATYPDFAVCGEFDLSIYFCGQGSNELQHVFSKGFCCK